MLQVFSSGQALSKIGTKIQFTCLARLAVDKAQRL